MTPERRSLLLAGGLLVPVVAGVLASVLTPAPHTGGDNAAYLALGHALEQGLGYVELWEPGVPPHTKYPPAFPLLLAGLMALGASAWVTFKGVMAVLVAVGVLLVFAWTAHRRGPLAGLAVALLTLLSAGWLDASRWILSEPLFLPLTFLALWAADRGGAKWPGGGGGPGMGDADRDGTRPPSTAQDRTRHPSTIQDGTRHPSTARRGAWLAVAGVAALLALLTRSAGLPLVLALGGALLLARRWRGAALFGAVAAGVAGGWALRARQGGEGAYQSEFWMRNPYEPELGTLGVGELPLRVWENLGIYLGGVLPGEWWPGGGVAHLVLGVGWVGVALAGWVLRLRRGEVGTAELFLPLYAGLILLWPPVWSGDRFALPLYPLFLLYAGEALVAGARLALARRAPGHLALVATAPAFLLLTIPAIPGWLATAEEAAACRRVAAPDVFRCLPPPVAEFRDAAAWSGMNLPEDAVVLNRKPRIFRVLGGTQGRVFPFSRDPEALLAEADALGARYLLVGYPDGVTMTYLPAVVQGRPGAFCVVESWGEATTLLGILPPGERDGPEVTFCPPGYGPAPGRGVGAPREGDGRVPLLAGRGPGP